LIFSVKPVVDEFMTGMRTVFFIFLNKFEKKFDQN